MRKFTWAEYYDDFYDWAESTRISYLSGLTDVGPAEEVCEIAEAFFDERASSRLIRKALAAGVRFTAEQVMDLELSVDKATLNQAAEATSNTFDREHLEELEGSLDDQVLERLVRKSGVDMSDPFSTSILSAVQAVNEMDLSALEAPVVERPRKPGFFAKLAAAAGVAGTLLGEEPHRAGRRCSGDCANCPPHYGYRYGRWYYGHAHTEGCQFGGNHGGGGRA